jgi:hypothetical protein
MDLSKKLKSYHKKKEKSSNAQRRKKKRQMQHLRRALRDQRDSLGTISDEFVNELYEQRRIVKEVEKELE